MSINETIGKDDRILKVTATDGDEPDTENSAIRYSLDATNGAFRIDAVTGWIYAASDDASECSSLGDSEFESNRIHFVGIDDDTSSSSAVAMGGERVCVFVVYAQDLGVPSQSGRTYVTVTFTDANNHAPHIQVQTFTGTDEIVLDENTPIGNVVAAVSVTDVDSIGETRLAIVDGNELDHFRLEAIDNSYLIRTNSSFDRRTVNEYNLTLMAMDNGIPPLSSSTHLLIHIDHVESRSVSFFALRLRCVSLTLTLSLLFWFRRFRRGSTVCLEQTRPSASS